MFNFHLEFHNHGHPTILLRQHLCQSSHIAIWDWFIDNYDLCRFKQMDPSLSRRGVEPVYCDKVKGQNSSQCLVDVFVQHI